MKLLIGITIGFILSWMSWGSLVQKGIMAHDQSAEIKRLKEQIMKANEQVEEWNKNFMATDYAKRNGIKNLKYIYE